MSTCSLSDNGQSWLIICCFIVRRATITATHFTFINRLLWEVVTYRNIFTMSLGRTHQEKKLEMIWILTWNFGMSNSGSLSETKRSWVIGISKSGININDVVLPFDIHKTTILLRKSFAPLTIISFYFKLPIPVKYGKMIWFSSNFQKMFSVPFTVVSVKDQ